MEQGLEATGRHLATQADACARLGSPLYERLLRACEVDLAAGGPVADVLAGHLGDAQDDLLGLRMLGGVHHLVLTGAADRLARQYPSAGGAPDGDLGPAFLATLATHREAVLPWLSQPPQTNEVGRSTALVGGLLHVLAGRDLPVVLHEVGASAGLNLLGDRFRHQVGPDGPWWGPARSPVRIASAWLGAAPHPAATLHVVQRHGSDIAPVDLREPGATDRLLAYVWPDQPARFDRLRGALQVAAEHPVPVQRTGAAEAVRQMVLRPGHLTVLWHSVMWQYLPAEEQRAVDEALADLGATADDSTPLARLSLEPPTDQRPGSTEFVVAATVWPGDLRRVLGTASPHGPPVTWRG